MRITYDDVLAARDRIRDGTPVTPCLRSSPLSELLGCDLYVKMDNLFRTGSFKERGARNALLQLSDKQKKIGVIAASAGNHALGLAHHGKLLNIPVTVVMPESAPIVKRRTCVQLGANVILEGQTFCDAYEEATRRSKQDGLQYVHGYDDPAIIAGQGVAGLEIVEQVQTAHGSPPDAIIVPIGGGGLIAGISTAVKHISPQTLIFGVEPERAATFHAAHDANHPVHVDVGKTLADGLATPDVGANAFETADPLIDGLVMVSEAAISLAVLRLMEFEKSVVEGAGAAGLAALLSEPEEGLLAGSLPDLRGKCVTIILSGGNIDPAMVGRVIERGLAADGRLMRFLTTVSDRPGGLSKLTAALASVGASVKDILHDRAFATSDLSTVDVSCIVETSGPEHAKQLLDLLQKEGFEVVVQHGREKRSVSASA
jgi:threonine dehydratase